MISPKLKAEELVEKYKIIIADDVVDMKIIYGTLTKKLAIKCVLISINELIKENYPTDIKRCEYWLEVKTEINKL